MRSERPIEGPEYVKVTYEQFNQTKSAAFIRRLCTGLSVLFLYPLIVLSKSSDYLFITCSELLSVIPFLFGVIMREAFYRKTLKACGRNFITEFGVFFYYRNASVGHDVLISAHTTIHHCDIGNNVLIGGGCRLLSGSSQHTYDRTDIPMSEQGGHMKKITIGDDVWIGDNSVIMDDIEAGCIIGAGSVVTKKIDAYSICAGNPATIIRKRK
jgi:acetyltransferase-like isoleucine patch superfamily enzyme